MSNYDTCLVCSSRERILQSIDQIKKLSQIIKNYNNRISNIVVEESVAYEWKKLKIIINNIPTILECLRKTLFNRVKRMNEMLEFIESNLEDYKSPCKFSEFLISFLEREETEKDLEFLKWILESPSRCQRVFSIIV